MKKRPMEEIEVSSDDEPLSKRLRKVYMVSKSFFFTPPNLLVLSSLVSQQQVISVEKIKRDAILISVFPRKSSKR